MRVPSLRRVLACALLVYCSIWLLQVTAHRLPQLRARVLSTLDVAVQGGRQMHRDYFGEPLQAASPVVETLLETNAKVEATAEVQDVSLGFNSDYE